MTPTSRLPSALATVTFATLTVLGGCAHQQAENPALGQFPGVQGQIESFYNANATENDWVCNEVEMNTIDKSQVVSQTERAKSADCVELMHRLGHDRFAIVGHDRGAYVAFRAALDHPDRISHLAVLDAVPILDALERCDARFAQAWWHWFFFAQPEKPERAILADPSAWYGGSASAMGRENYADYQWAIHDPATVHAMVEDYRAGLGIDREHDAASRRAGRRLECPVLCLWAAQDDLVELYGDVIAVWRPWADDLRGASVDCGHHIAEEAPEDLAEHLREFLAEPGAGAGSSS